VAACRPGLCPPPAPPGHASRPGHENVRSLQAATPFGVDRRTPHRQTRQGPSSGRRRTRCPAVGSRRPVTPHVAPALFCEPVRFVRPLQVLCGVVAPRALRSLRRPDDAR